MKKIILYLVLLPILLISLYAIYLWVTSPKPREVEFSEQDFKIKTVYYGHDTLPTKTIIIFPPTGGINILDKLYAHALWKSGMDVYIYTEWTGSDEYALDLDIHQRFYTRVQKGLGILISHIKTPFIGMLGTSVGGIHTSVAMSTHDRLDSALVITTGNPIPEVIVFSSQEAMRDARKKRYEMFHFKDDQDYLSHLSAAFHLDPSTRPRKFEGKKLGVITASEDTVVPTANQDKLQRLWGAKELLRLPNDHFLGIVKTGIFHRDLVVEFFNQ
jgi:hypothetical protein